MNSIRDDMKDEIRQVLKDHFDRNLESREIDNDLIANLADVVFNVMDIDPADQDRPKGKDFKFDSFNSYEEGMPGYLAERGVELAKNLLSSPDVPYLIAISSSEEILAIFDQNEEFVGLVPF